jgi:hypothetical protein
LKIEPALSTAFHPQTDGQTERINAIMEQYLRAYVSYLQDDWKRFLPTAQFAANNQVSETTKLSPFFTLYGINPKCSFDLDNKTEFPEEEKAQEAAKRLAEIHDFAKAEMRYAQDRFSEAADKSRMPAPLFKPGDRVWLDGRNLRTQRPSRKLENRNHGPYRIV